VGEVVLIHKQPVLLPLPPLLPLLLLDTIIAVHLYKTAVVDPIVECIGSIADSSHTILIVVVTIEC
jgi:hypothetical protein